MGFCLQGAACARMTGMTLHDLGQWLSSQAMFLCKLVCLDLPQGWGLPIAPAFPMVQQAITVVMESYSPTVETWLLRSICYADGKLSEEGSGGGRGKKGAEKTRRQRGLPACCLSWKSPVVSLAAEGVMGRIGPWDGEQVKPFCILVSPEGSISFCDAPTRVLWNPIPTWFCTPE